jgi:ubiquinol-cytochrome c reductase cytochrome b subunit
VIAATNTRAAQWWTWRMSSPARTSKVMSSAVTTYDGSYEPLQGQEVSRAFNSALDITFDVRAGLLMRQVHHWAALVFVAAITVHLLRIFFTGAFRRPREINWVIGVTLMIASLGNGFFGYSLLDDQLSGTGIRIAYSVIISIPFVGPWIASLLFGGNFPSDEMIPRMFSLHILIIPAIIVLLLVLHMAFLVRHKHTHFPGLGARDDNVVGERLWPTYTFKAMGLLFLVSAILAALGGWAQINPVWIYGPFEPENVSSASQPDWYVGWLEGSLRLMPNWEVRVGEYSVPNPFWGGALLPLVGFGLLYTWPWLEARFTRDRDEHHVLDRPRDRPVRTAFGVAGILFFTVMLFAGSDDVLAVTFDLSVNATLWTFRVLLFVAPLVGWFVTWRICHELQSRDGPFVDPYLDDTAPAGDDDTPRPTPSELEPTVP